MKSNGAQNTYREEAIFTLERNNNFSYTVSGGEVTVCLHNFRDVEYFERCRLDFTCAVKL
jgi:hypothetical protein